MRSIVIPVVAVTTALVSALSGCSDDRESVPDTAATRVVPTDHGDVTIPADPQRVVVLNHALAGYLFDLDQPVVATTSESVGGAEEFPEFWADDAREAGTTFVPWSADGFDLEAVARAEPDLIVGGGLGFPLALAEKVYDRLGAIAPTVLVSGSKSTWQDQYSYLADDVFGLPEVYDRDLSAYDERLAAVREAITPPPTPASFLTFTADGRPFALVESVGLPLVFRDLGIEPAPIFAEGDFEVYGGAGDMFEVTPEHLGDTVTQPTVFVMGFNGDTVDLDALRADPAFSRLPAFAADHVYELPHWALRGDYDEAMALLDEVEKLFG